MLHRSVTTDRAYIPFVRYVQADLELPTEPAGECSHECRHQGVTIAEGPDRI